MKVEVLVAGGGSAGLAAAVASARLGARTLLVERSGLLGGTAPGALVHTICGLYRLPEEGKQPEYANPGFAVEFAQKMIQAGATSGPVRMGRVDVLLQQPAEFGRIATEMTRGMANLEVRLQAEVVAVAKDLSRVEILGGGESQHCEVGAIVDTTGDGNVAALCGAEFELSPPDRLQRPAFIFALGAVASGAVAEGARLRIAKQLVEAVRNGRLSRGTLGAAFRESSQPGEVYVTIDLAGGVAYEPLDRCCVADLEAEGREIATALASFLSKEVAGFEGSVISALPSRLGIRESRRVVGQYTLTEDDLLRGAEFEDAIALATWPMELRETNTGPRLRYPAEGKPCGIPLRCLRARGQERLFVAGRCISASHEAQASIRVMGTGLATGEAAGLAAALLVRQGAVDAAAVRAAREKLSR